MSHGIGSINGDDCGLCNSTGNMKVTSTYRKCNICKGTGRVKKEISNKSFLPENEIIKVVECDCDSCYGEGGTWEDY